MQGTHAGTFAGNACRNARRVHSKEAEMLHRWSVCACRKEVTIMRNTCFLFDVSAALSAHLEQLPSSTRFRACNDCPLSPCYFIYGIYAWLFYLWHICMAISLFHLCRVIACRNPHPP
jgi:hypothetical protein